MAKVLLLGVMLCCINDVSAATHSLKYFFTGVTAGTDLPEFTAVSLVDDEPLEYYDSNMKSVISRTEWLGKSEDQQYWDERTQRARGVQQFFKAYIEKLMRHFNQTQGVHVFQRMCGCEWDDETGITDGFNHYGYDGEDFLVFDMKNTRWISPSPQGVSTAHNWNYFPAHLEYDKSYMTQECIEWLKKYVSYGRSTLERTVAPEVSLLQKDPSSPVVCHVTGFFPRVIMVTWQKKGEDHYDDVEWEETLPNEDGTFQTTSRLTVKDWQTENYTCVVEHKSLEKDIVKRVIEREIRRNQDIETRGPSMAVIIVVGVLLLLLLHLIAIGVVVWKKGGAARDLLMVDIMVVGVFHPLLLALGVVVWEKSSAARDLLMADIIVVGVFHPLLLALGVWKKRVAERGLLMSVIIMGGVHYLLLLLLVVVGVVVWRKKRGAERGLLMAVIIMVGVLSLLLLVVVRVVVWEKRVAARGPSIIGCVVGVLLLLALAVVGVVVWCGRREAQATGRLTPLTRSLRTLNSNLQSKPEITLPNAQGRAGGELQQEDLTLTHSHTHTHTF
ncbi:hypothetical protein AAFF_G00333760 [Aldrovandia affinis]|uniref:Ig-like domain-containing protein n=1 Tax=Aldrovandia affinis TaxID=143900 RepID=A0AAD7R6V9_9TELE|nr:hypothetical protein AAFF_G00333760 [Aldrovandia affinis]